MDIKPPYAYQDIVALTTAHRVTMPDARALPPAFHNLDVLPLSMSEFAPACRDYPIVFISSDGGTSFMPMLVLGLAPQQNLYVLRDQMWDCRVYLPAYVRRYPFCMARVTVDGKEQSERIACVEKRAISEGGTALHDDKGEPLPVWKERRKLLFEFEADLARTEEFCRTLAGLGLFEVFTLQALPTQGPPLTLTGLYRVPEEKLHALPAEKLKELAQNGMLARIYAHLMSLDHFRRLLDRRVELARVPAAGG